MTAFVLAAPTLEHIKRVIPILGISMAVLTFCSVVAAAVAMSDLRIHIQRLTKDTELKNFPSWGRRELHFFGMAPAVVIPILFSAFWIYCILNLS